MQDRNASHLSSDVHSAGALEAEARPCPECGRPMTVVTHREDCPCDAPWCSQVTRELTCLECSARQAR